MDSADEAWHDSMKPKWTPTGTLLYAQGGLSAQTAGDWQDFRLLAGEGRDVFESVLRGADKDVSLIMQGAFHK